MKRYSPNEFPYARPVAHALLTDSVFRHWFLRKTKFTDRALDAVPLTDQPRNERTTETARKWFWFNCFCGVGCECKVETGIETDILMVFEAPDQSRFAIHIEVKPPRKALQPGQAESYPHRGRCWAKARVERPAAVPKWIPRHDDFVTILICDDGLMMSDPRCGKFDDVFLYKDIEQRISPYPDLADLRQS